MTPEEFTLLDAPEWVLSTYDCEGDESLIYVLVETRAHRRPVAKICVKRPSEDKGSR